MMIDIPEHESSRYGKAVDLDVDIGADAVDYNAIAKQGKSFQHLNNVHRADLM